MGTSPWALLAHTLELEIGSHLTVRVDRHMRHDLHQEVGRVPVADELETVDRCEVRSAVFITWLVETGHPDSGTPIRAPLPIDELRALRLEMSHSRNPVVVLGVRDQPVESSGGVGQRLTAEVLTREHNSFDREREVLLDRGKCRARCPERRQ